MSEWDTQPLKVMQYVLLEAEQSLTLQPTTPTEAAYDQDNVILHAVVERSHITSRNYQDL